MGRLVVKLSQQRNQVYPLAPGAVVLGRGEGADLVLPNVSVSREHARIVVDRQHATIEDLGSQNGTTVNGQPVTRQPLRSGDEIGVGRFTLIYLGSGREDRFYKGRYVGYLPRYDASSVVAPGALDNAATFALTADALKAMQTGNRVVEHARLLSEADEGRFWYPEDRGLSFGSAGLVPITGWLTWGVVATVTWDGRRHVLEKKGWLGHASVNGQAVRRQPLRNGDRVRIGGSRFRYERPS